MSSAVVAPSSFNASKVTFSPLKLLDSGGKQAYLNYEGRNLVMQVGSLTTPFGMNVFDKAGPVKYSVDLKLQGYDDPVNHPKVAQIYNAMSALDNYMIDQGVANSKQWFKAPLTRDVVSAFYTPIVRFAKDAEGNVKNYPPTIKLQLRQRDGKFETAVYDDKKRPMTDIPMEDILVKGAAITALIQCTGVWFAGSKFGLSWKAVQIRVDKLPDSIRGFAFLEEGDAPAEAAPAPTRRAAAPAPVNQFAELEEEDEDAIDDEEAIAPPAPVKQAPAPAAVEEDAEDAAPIAVPAKKTTITKKKVIVAAKK